MSVEVGRRVFLGSAAVAGIGSAGVAFTFPQGLNAHVHESGGTVDVEIERQLRDSVRGLRGTKRGESARHLASTLRLAAAQHKEKGTDEAFKAFLRKEIRKEGRSALLAREIDATAFAKETKKFGVTQLPALSSIDLGLREKVLESLLAGGLTAMLSSVAKTFEELSDGIDNQPAALLISARQQVPMCPDLTQQMRILETTLAIACIFNQIMCVIITGMWVGLMISLTAMGC
jgi:hypothetical protein